MRDFNEIASEEIIIRHKYLELLMARCIECNKINYEYRDPLLKRVLCITCRSLIKYHVIGKTEIKTLFRICPDQLNLKFGFTPGFANGYGLITYIDLLFKSLRNFREKNKRFVLDKLYEELDDNCKLVRDINEINPGNMDKVHEQFGRIEKVEVNWDCDNHDKDYRNIYKFIRNGTAKINFQKIFKKLKGKCN